MLVSPLTLVNLLPYDLHYEVKIPGSPNGRVKPGEDACLHSVDPAESVTLVLWTDTLSPCGEISLNPSSSPYLVTLKLQDAQKRLLYLHLKVQLQYGGALKVGMALFCLALSFYHMLSCSHSPHHYTPPLNLTIIPNHHILYVILTFTCHFTPLLTLTMTHRQSLLSSCMVATKKNLRI